MVSESALEFRRRRAVELIKQGESRETISRVLGVCRHSLNVWLQKAQAGESLKSNPSSGRPRRLNERQLAELEQLLKKGATAHGWENDIWTTRRVGEVIKRNFAIGFCPSGVWHVLHDYLHWSPIRPAKQAAKRNEAEISRWKSVEFPKIEREARQRNAYLAFVDEAGFMMTPTIRRTFAPRGSTPVTKIWDPHGRISVSGTISISPSRTRALFWFYVLGDNTNFRSPSIVEALKDLRMQIPGPLTIIWDQNIIHASETLLQYLQTVPDLRTEFFPPYAPELNPVDRAWFYLKYNRLPNYAPPTIARLRRVVRTETRRLQKKPDLLRSFIRQSKLPLAL
jgi:transposase